MKAFGRQFETRQREAVNAIATMSCELCADQQCFNHDTIECSECSERFCVDHIQQCVGCLKFWCAECAKRKAFLIARFCDLCAPDIGDVIEALRRLCDAIEGQNPPIEYFMNLRKARKRARKLVGK